VSIHRTFEMGCEILDPVMQRHGFIFKRGASGRGSGGTFVSGHYAREDRRLDLHIRYSLGLVTYRIGSLSISHESYMRALLGKVGGNRYPGFSDDLLDGFRALKFDLEHYSSDFLYGSGEEFGRCVEHTREQEKLSGFKRLHSE
jgi:hypothetical protein